MVAEANTSGLWLPAATPGAPRHDWLTLPGGPIGQGLALAAGCAHPPPDPARAAISALTAYHGLRNQDIRGLLLTSIDGIRLRIGGRTIPACRWRQLCATPP